MPLCVFAFWGVKVLINCTEDRFCKDGPCFQSESITAKTAKYFPGTSYERGNDVQIRDQEEVISN